MYSNLYFPNLAPTYICQQPKKSLNWRSSSLTFKNEQVNQVNSYGLKGLKWPKNASEWVIWKDEKFETFPFKLQGNLTDDDMMVIHPLLYYQHLGH